MDKKMFMWKLGRLVEYYASQATLSPQDAEMCDHVSKQYAALVVGVTQSPCNGCALEGAMTCVPDCPAHDDGTPSECDGGCMEA